jgi:speckle-type POZ protein
MFKELLRYIYCGYINEQVLQDQTVEILAIADKFDVEGLRNKCEVLLLQRITKSNAASILQAADLYHAVKLKKKVLSVVTEHFMEIIATDAWKELCSHSLHLVGEITDAVAVKAGTKQVSDDINNSGVKRKRA